MVVFSRAKKSAVFLQAIYQHLSKMSETGIELRQLKTTILDAFGHQGADFVSRSSLAGTFGNDWRGRREGLGQQGTHQASPAYPTTLSHYTLSFCPPRVR